MHCKILHTIHNCLPNGHECSSIIVYFWSIFHSQKFACIFGKVDHSNEKSNFGKVFLRGFLDAISSVLLCQKTAFKALCGYARLAFLRSKAQDLSRNGNVIRMGKKESGQHLVWPFFSEVHGGDDGRVGLVERDVWQRFPTVYWRKFVSLLSING